MSAPGETWIGGEPAARAAGSAADGEKEALRLPGSGAGCGVGAGYGVCCGHGVAAGYGVWRGG